MVSVQMDGKSLCVQHEQTIWAQALGFIVHTYRDSFIDTQPLGVQGATKWFSAFK